MPPHDANPLTGQHSWQEFRAARGRYLARSSDSRPPHPLSDRVESLVAAWNTHDPDGIAEALCEFFGLELRGAPESRLPTERERASALEIEARLRASLGRER